MTSELFLHIQQHGACVDLSARAKFQLSGVDRVRYLNGQVTNDVRKTCTEEAIYACLTNAKGRMEADVFIHAAEDGQALLLDAEAMLREPLGLRLDRYIVADDVELQDVTDQWRIWHYFGAAAQEYGSWSRQEGVNVVKTSRFGIEGIDVWVPVNSDFRNPKSEVLSTADLETWRICMGVPRWPFELNNHIFPPEAGLEARAMNFTKGCYIGQEVLSRIKLTGKMPARLVHFRLKGSATDLGPPEAWKIGTRSEDDVVKEVGTVTSTCLHPVLDRWTGLAYLRLGAQLSDSFLLAGSEPTRISTELEFL